MSGQHCENYDVRTGPGAGIPWIQFTVTREMLTAVARDQRWPNVVAGISARFSILGIVLFCYITNHLMTGPLRNIEFCFPRKHFGKQ